MKEENITILKCSVTNKRITADYHCHLDDLNYTVEKDEPSHPDLGKAMSKLDSYLADAFFAKKDAQQNFKVKGFTIDDGDGISTIQLDGSGTNVHDYSFSPKSGKIPFESEELIAKVEAVRHELFRYFFEGHTAQGTLPGMQARGLATQDGSEEEGKEE